MFWQAKSKRSLLFIICPITWLKWVFISLSTKGYLQFNRLSTWLHHKLPCASKSNQVKSLDSIIKYHIYSVLIKTYVCSWESSSLNVQVLFRRVRSTKDTLILHHLNFLYSDSDSLHNFQKLLTTMYGTIILRDKNEKEKKI